LRKEDDQRSAGELTVIRRLTAARLFWTYHSSLAIAIYSAVCAIITLIATALMTNYAGKDISGEYN
jgi:hypothetical protein